MIKPCHVSGVIFHVLVQIIRKDIYGKKTVDTCPPVSRHRGGAGAEQDNYRDASLNTNELLWNAQLSQSLLKGNALTVSLQFYDILHRQSNLSRVISAVSRTDTEYNSINSYIMLRATYRLNLFGGRNAMPRPKDAPPFDHRGPGMGPGPGPGAGGRSPMGGGF